MLKRAGLFGAVVNGTLVPDLVLRSWRRSLGSRVDGETPVGGFQDVDTDTILCRAASPVLDRWQHQLADTGLTLFLGDRAGSIVARRTSDSSVKRRLDRAHAAEGFDYSEESVGTNGLGTSMVERRPVMIQGSQHYHDALARLACAAAPVCAPSGSVLGSVSLGTYLEGASPLMLSLTREIGQQIEERLRADARPQDLALAMSFMRFTNSQRPTVVLDSESLLANTPGLAYVSVTSHVLLWELLNTHDWSREAAPRFVLAEPGVDVLARRVASGPRAHYVLHFSPLPQAKGLIPQTRAVRDLAPITPADRPTRRAVVVVAGPPGSGRAHLAHDLHRQADPTVSLAVRLLDAHGEVPVAAVGDLLIGGTDVLLRRAEALPEPRQQELERLVREHRTACAGDPNRGMLIVTTTHARADQISSAGDLVVRTEALASQLERVPGLVKSVLDQVDPNGHHTMSPAALQALVQHTWPENLSELVETVAAVARSVPGPVIERRHLPPHLQQAPGRRHRTLMELAEREAILRALAAADGNKSEAAVLLGVGRSTLYRRLRQHGLDGDETSLGGSSSGP